MGFKRKLEDAEVWKGPADGSHVETVPSPGLTVGDGGPRDGDTRRGFGISFTSPAGPDRTLFHVWVPASAYAQIALAMQQGDPHAAGVVFDALADRPRRP